MEWLRSLFDAFWRLVDLFLHLDKHLSAVIADYGVATYAILFLIIFCETGLVVTPILPGDSLLFAAGALTAGSPLKIEILIPLLIAAAIVGDAVNYAIGKRLGPRVLERDGRFLKKEYLEKTQRFYEKYGGKTIVFARFVPIIRTFAPFLAGVGGMSYRRFFLYNVVGAVVWVGMFVLGGYWFGNIPLVKDNFTLVVLAIIFVSILPALVEYLKVRYKSA